MTVGKKIARLEAHEVTVAFEGLKAVDGVSLSIDSGEILGLIGPNGAGKTTLVNALTGYQRLTAGYVTLDDVVVNDWPAYRYARAGLVRTFQSVRLFTDLTVYENVLTAALGVGTTPRAARALTWALLHRMSLSDQADRRASTLPYGDERRLGIARTLASQPRLVLLDEPAAGLSEDESDGLASAILTVRDDLGCGLLIIEHDMRLIMSLCETIHVLDYGKTLAEGPPAEVRSNPDVIRAYLGTEEDLEIATG